MPVSMQFVISTFLSIVPVVWNAAMMSVWLKLILHANSLPSHPLLPLTISYGKHSHISWD